jgi:hypothetical protein
MGKHRASKEDAIPVDSANPQVLRSSKKTKAEPGCNQNDGSTVAADESSPQKGGKKKRKRDAELAVAMEDEAHVDMRLPEKKRNKQHKRKHPPLEDPVDEPAEETTKEQVEKTRRKKKDKNGEKSRRVTEELEDVANAEFPSAARKREKGSQKDTGALDREEKKKKKKKKKHHENGSELESQKSQARGNESVEEVAKNKRGSRIESPGLGDSSTPTTDTTTSAPLPEGTMKERWNVEDLGGGAKRQDKFMRLLGGKKAAATLVGTETLAGAKFRPRLDINKASKDLEQQYEAGVRMKFDAGGKRRGLGA